MPNIFPLTLPTYVLVIAASITALFAVTTIILGLGNRPAWRSQARIASYCSLAVLSASIATENAAWGLAALAFYVLWPCPAVNDGK